MFLRVAIDRRTASICVGAFGRGFPLRLALRRVMPPTILVSISLMCVSVLLLILGLKWLRNLSRAVRTVLGLVGSMWRNTG